MSVIDTRTRELTPRKAYGLIIFAVSAFINLASSFIHHTSTQVSHCYQSRPIEYEDFLDRNLNGTSNTTHPFAQVYITPKANNETYTINDMLKEPDKAEFLKAMTSEVASLFSEKIWALVPREEMTQHYVNQRKTGKTIDRQQIMMIWLFKRKQYPDSTFNKCKSKLCCHGGQKQWGVNYWENYATVVSWSSVRILMTLAKLYNLHTKSVDFIQAYPQVAVKSSIYLFPPTGVILIHKNNTLVLKLLKNLYGLKDAGRTWLKYLTNGLLSMILVATSSDPCIFTKGTNVIILYVNDCIIMSRTNKYADEIFAELEQ